MKRLLLLTLLSLFAVYSNAHTEEPDPLSFFPHHVGDTWAYRYDEVTVISSTITKIEHDEERSVLIYINYNIKPAYKIDSIYNVYFSPMGSNYLDYKLTATKGDIWLVKKDTHSIGTSMYAKVQDVYNTIVFGRIATVKEIAYFEVPNPDTTITDNSAYVYTHFLASGFGFIRHLGEAGDVWVDLVGCIINGDTLGTVTGVEEAQTETSSLHIFPNPCTSLTTIRYSSSEGMQRGHIELVDMFGRTVYSTDIQTDTYTLNTSTLSNGIYFCRVTAGTHTAVRKIIVCG